MRARAWCTLRDGGSAPRLWVALRPLAAGRSHARACSAASRRRRCATSSAWRPTSANRSSRCCASTSCRRYLPMRRVAHARRRAGCVRSSSSRSWCARWSWRAEPHRGVVGAALVARLPTARRGPGRARRCGRGRRGARPSCGWPSLLAAASPTKALAIVLGAERARRGRHGRRWSICWPTPRPRPRGARATCACGCEARAAARRPARRVRRARDRRGPARACKR